MLFDTHHDSLRCSSNTQYFTSYPSIGCSKALMRDCLFFHPKENQRSVNLPKWKRHSGWVYSRFNRTIASILARYSKLSKGSRFLCLPTFFQPCPISKRRRSLGKMFWLPFEGALLSCVEDLAASDPCHDHDYQSLPINQQAFPPTLKTTYLPYLTPHLKP